MAKHYDLAIRWDDSKSPLRRVWVAGGIGVVQRPKYLRPGKWVALVTHGNQIELMFRVDKIEESDKARLADGRLMAGAYFIKADTRTMRQLDPPIPSPFKGWHAIGAFRYFRERTMTPVFVGKRIRRQGPYIEDGPMEISGTMFLPHTTGIPGRPRGHPESTLVNQYGRWLGEDVRFGHNYIRSARLFVDLFDLTHWQLLEAKISTSRETIRMAIGQLRDYKRFYTRPPTLGVLLSSRPSAACMRLLTDNRISVIWRTPMGSFSTRKWNE